MTKSTGTNPLAFIPCTLSGFALSPQNSWYIVAQPSRDGSSIVSVSIGTRDYSAKSKVFQIKTCLYSAEGGVTVLHVIISVSRMFHSHISFTPTLRKKILGENSKDWVLLSAPPPPPAHKKARSCLQFIISVIFEVEVTHQSWQLNQWTNELTNWPERPLYNTSCVKKGDINTYKFCCSVYPFNHWLVFSPRTFSRRERLGSPPNEKLLRHFCLYTEFCQKPSWSDVIGFEKFRTAAMQGYL